MVRLESDLIDLFMAVGRRTLDEAEVKWSQGEGAPAAASCCIVLAAEGYPNKPVNGAVITGIDKAEAMEGVRVFYAAVKKNPKGEIVTAGGRVLNVVGVGETLAQARARAYEAANLIRFKGKQMRTDIGAAAEAVHH
jgi:phosphoribosylamine--glycine ligase